MFPGPLKSMAADYVAEIRAVQPHGPYFLAGYSFGGRVSFEIAQQLVRAGERVSFLGMIDTTFHDQSVEGRPWVPEVVKLSDKVCRRHVCKIYSITDWDLYGGGKISIVGDMDFDCSICGFEWAFHSV